MALVDQIQLPTLNYIHRRPRLLNQLIDFVEAQQRLISIYAPGGYGKSILLTDFAQTTDLPVCWCSLIPANRDPASFLTLLAYSITDRFHEIDPAQLDKIVARGDTEMSIHHIVETLATVGEHIIIIDEMDAVCRARGTRSDSTGVGDTVVNQLLAKIALTNLR